MIGHQQPTSFHLILSVVLLLLTAYPYLFNPTCCSVAAYSALDMDLRHHAIDKFDIIVSDSLLWSHPIATRDTAQLLQDNNDTTRKDTTKPPSVMDDTKHIPRSFPIRKVQFYSLGRRFNLVLTKPTHLITNDFTVISIDKEGKETIVPYKRNEVVALEGYLDGEKKSSWATASFTKNEEKNELMTAHIKTGNDTIIVEPTYLHKDNLWSSSSSSTAGNNISSQKLYDSTMIVYKLSDHKQFSKTISSDGEQFDTNKLCPSINMNEYTNYTSATMENSTTELDKIFNHDRTLLIPKRTKRRIDYLVAQDKTRCTLHLVADYLFYKNVGQGDLQSTINYLLSLIHRVNQIYLPTVWESGDETLERFKNIGFIVQNITIHQEFTRLSSDTKHYNMQREMTWEAREYLDNFSLYSPPRHYCLAHLLTYRQFSSPVLGLAYVASTRFGAIGGICSPTQRKGDDYYKHNTGISTFKGIGGEQLITRQADLVVAHELGHNLGSEHDSDSCRPGPEKGGAYLMHPFAVMGFDRNNRFLSNCSRRSIGQVIKKKGADCFVTVADHVCGNGVVEDEEECDGGDLGFEHNDPCCDSNCKFNPGAQCSDRHSFCCSKCRILTAGHQCSPAEEFDCKQASYCDGRSASCPRPAPVEDNKTCVGRGMCRNGYCIPFCEANQQLSCLCNTPGDACKLCCKSTMNSTCRPYDSRAPYLNDGVLCYRGVCEKGRCEQQVQDFVQRLWDVIEDVNFSTFVKFLRDNILFVVLVTSIPIWCIASHYINEFDHRIKTEVLAAIARSTARKKKLGPSPFLPTLFVPPEDLNNDLNSMDNSGDETQMPLRPPIATISDQMRPQYQYGWRMETDV